MRSFPLAPVAIVALTLLAGCATDETVTTRTESAAVRAPTATDRQIVLTQGDSLGVQVGADGSVEIRVTVLAGKPNAGAYTSRDADLLDVSRAAQNALDDPNTVVTVTINARGEVGGVAYAVTL